MSFLENIKLIASELSSMSPRTQLEIVKLCKDLCIETKNYLVELDETTLPLIDTKIQALETATNNLQTLYTNIADELQTAEGNITANANAIELLQGSVEAITEALNGIYTKSQVDTLLNAKADKLDTYTKTEVDTLLSAKANSADVYTKTQVDTALSGKASLSGNNTFTGTNTFNDADDFYFTEQDDSLQALLNEKQDVLTAGSGITIQNNVISATGGGVHLYHHTLSLDLEGYDENTREFLIRFYSTDNTPITLSNLSNYADLILKTGVLSVNDSDFYDVNIERICYVSPSLTTLQYDDVNLRWDIYFYGTTQNETSKIISPTEIDSCSISELSDTITQIM